MNALTWRSAPRRSTNSPPTRRHVRRRRSALVQGRRSSTSCTSRRSSIPNDDGIGDFAGLTAKLDYMQGPRRQHDLAAAVLSLAAARRRLRRRRLPRRASAVRHARRLPGHSCARRTGAACASSPSCHQPHLRPASVVPGGAARAAGLAEAQLLRLERRPTRKYAGTRIIFTDTEKSNWTWDPVAKAYYWHRFFSHQPDLNFDNPRCSKAVFRVMRFWLDMGVDGFRLDAIPYLVEREGTNNENLPETHAVHQAAARGDRRELPEPLPAGRGEPVARGRARVFRRRRRMPHGVPLPADAAHVHGASRRRTATRSSRSWRRRRTSRTNCQWAIFLRNHDELTLEMVTSKRARLHVPARTPPTRARASTSASAAASRRCSRTTRDRIKLMNSLLLSHAGLADRLLRRRDRHGRQRLSRRPQRRAHADAVEPGPQRRLLARRPAAPVPAADHGCRLRLPGGQRRGAVARAVVAAQLDAAHAGGAQGSTSAFGRGTLRVPEARQPQDPRLPARVRRRVDPVRRQPRALARSRSSSTSRPTRAACRSSCSAAPRSRRSASCPTC